MKASLVVIIVVIMHVCVIGGVMFIQGCGTTPVTQVEPPPSPIMPPVRPAPIDTARTSEPMFKPPRPVAPAPAVMDVGDQKTYVVRKGDTLSEIAKRYSVSYKELAEINDIDNPNTIRVGQKLILPAYAGQTAPSKPQPAARQPEARQPVSVPPGGTTYVVQRGDYLGKIARQYGTSVAELKDVNNLSSDRILIGQKLAIPGSGGRSAQAAKPASRPAPEPAVETNTPEEPAASRTPVVEEETKETPVVPAPEPAPSPTAQYSEKPFPYQVGEGETLEDIAKAFVVSTNDILKVNEMNSASEIKPGQTIYIPSSY